MSVVKKRLDDALTAGRAIESGGEIPHFFEKVEELMSYEYEESRFGVYSIQFSSEREMFVAGYGDGSIDVLSMRSEKKELDIKKPKDQQLATTCIRFHPKQHFLFLAASAGGGIHLCSRVDGSCEEIATENDNQINALSFSNDGRQFATAGSDYNVRVYDSNTAQVVHLYEGYKYECPEQSVAGHAKRIFALKYHPHHEEVFVTGGWDNCLKVWDCRQKDGLVRTIVGPHICGDGLDIKDLKILTASWTADKALEVYDFAMNRKLETLPFPHEGSGQFLYTARFCDNDIVVAGGSGTNSMKAIHLNSSQVIGEVSLGKHPVHTLDILNGGRLVAVGGAGRILKIAKVG